MVREDRVIMSVKELRRVSVIRQTMEKKLTQVKAGTLLGLTTRHIRRLIERVEQEGDQGLAHRGRGMPSNRRLPAKGKAKANVPRNGQTPATTSRKFVVTSSPVKPFAPARRAVPTGLARVLSRSRKRSKAVSARMRTR